MGAFSSDDTIEQERFERQGGHCACCDKELVWESSKPGGRGAWHAHHIDGNSKNNALANCAVVCINETRNCHLNVAHSGDFVNGQLAPRSAFLLNR